ncbi:MAG: esterase-like activity of phytase family protein [Neomegalonema sp.]|nr:esterase-like activity of phytase family protein [Neomegalonema sp.]
MAEYRLPTGLRMAGVEFGGISGLDYDPKAGVFWALSDDRAEIAPARFYGLKIDIKAAKAGRPAYVAGVDIFKATAMGTKERKPYAAKSLDPEALRLKPGGGFYWAHERDAKGKPFVGEMGADGINTRSYTLPDYYMPGIGVGVRVNLGFESLTVDKDGAVIVATEQALTQDGPETTPDSGSRARVLKFDPKKGAPIAEYVYPVGPVAATPVPAKSFKTNGLVEMLALPSGGFLAMERSFSVGQGNVVKLFVTDFKGATDVLGQKTLGKGVKTMRKRTVLTLMAGGMLKGVDNLEAMTFGPKVDGKQTLILMSDNNFNPNGQFTQILVFTIE